MFKGVIMKHNLALGYIENYLFQKYQVGVSLLTLKKELQNRNLNKILIRKLIRLLILKIKIEGV